MTNAPIKIKYALVALGVLASGYLIYSLVFSGYDPGEASRRRAMIDTKTEEVFTRYRLEEGQSPPYENPKTGERTLMPAEKCYWTKDENGQWAAKLEPTYVLLNAYKGEEGSTICPDCGREVVGHNPTPPTELMAAAAKRAGKGDG